MNDLKKNIKKILPNKLKKKISYLLNIINKFKYSVKASLNKNLFFNKLIYKKNKVHLGCGDIKLKKFLNIDCRPTKAVDIINDCTNLSILPKNYFLEVYSHAFFEHLFPNQRVPCLKSIYRILKDNGLVFFIGIPDFEQVAKAYLNKEKGLLSEKFDLYHVQRFTHDPVIADCMSLEEDGWLEQVHKSLFDIDEIEKLLKNSGFNSFIIFDYCFKDDHLAVSLGFIAFKTKPLIKIDEEWIKKFIKKYKTDINLDTLTNVRIRIEN